MLVEFGVLFDDDCWWCEVVCDVCVFKGVVFEVVKCVLVKRVGVV